jgi:periplasmic protein TonB
MMSAHDTLDEQERLRGPLLGSLALHGGMIAAFVALTVLQPFGRVEHWGDPNGGRFGAVAINAVPTIPLPNRTSVQNPVANNTESQVPQAPSKPKPQPKVKAPDPNAIALRSKKAKEKPVREAAPAPNKWADQQPRRPNQVYSTSGQMAGSPLYQMQGGGGQGVGIASPFGDRFGSYANLVRGKVEGAWRTSDVNARIQTAPPVTVQFTIRKDGSAPGLPRIVQSSGDGNLDRSAQRAVLDAAPFPPLPAGFDRSEAVVELTFQLRR